VLEEVYSKQSKLMGREVSVYFKEQFNFPDIVQGVGDNFVNFVDEGPADELQLKLAINEFDRSFRAHMNFTNPECFKALVLPLGLEELRVVV
jgi:hypothetical protein